MNTMADRIRIALDTRGMTPSDLIRLKVLSKAGVYFLLDGTTTAEKVRADTITKLCKALTVNRDWLLNGRGTMDRPNFTESSPASQSQRIDPTKLAESIAALRQVAANTGWVYDPQTNAEETVYAYELRCQMPAVPTTADIIDFASKVAQRLQQQSRGSEIGPGDSRQVGKAHRKRP